MSSSSPFGERDKLHNSRLHHQDNDERSLGHRASRARRSLVVVGTYYPAEKQDIVKKRTPVCGVIIWVFMRCGDRTRCYGDGRAGSGSGISTGCQPKKVVADAARQNSNKL